MSSSVRLFVRVRNIVCYLEIFGGRVKNLEIINHLEVTWRLPQKPGVSRQNLETWHACYHADSKKCSPYRAGSRMCNLCLCEKLFILKNEATVINIRDNIPTNLCWKTSNLRENSSGQYLSWQVSWICLISCISCNIIFV